MAHGKLELGSGGTFDKCKLDGKDLPVHAAEVKLVCGVPTEITLSIRALRMDMLLEHQDIAILLVDPRTGRKVRLDHETGLELVARADGTLTEAREVARTEGRRAVTILDHEQVASR